MRKVVLSLFVLFFFGVTTAHILAAGQETYPEPEAKKWFQEPKREGLFAPRRFSSDDTAQRFIDRLYRAGAIYVGIVCVTGDASGLKVYLPLNIDKREEILKIANLELTRAGYRSEVDRGQEDLTIWFQ